jgi:GNAT superfamily N-acetyltransferase
MPTPAAAPPLIRTAVADDDHALATLATHLGYPVDAAAMSARMARIRADDGYQTFVAEVDRRVVGFAGVTWKWSYVEDEPRAQLLSLVVDPAERGRGTGAALVAAAEAWARERGAGAIHLTTALHRQAAHRFYERIGYARTGYRYVKSFGEGTH